MSDVVICVRYNQSSLQGGMISSIQVVKIFFYNNQTCKLVQYSEELPMVQNMGNKVKTRTCFWCKLYRPRSRQDCHVGGPQFPVLQVIFQLLFVYQSYELECIKSVQDAQTRKMPLLSAGPLRQRKQRKIALWLCKSHFVPCPP